MDRFEAMKVYMRVSELSSFVKAAESLGMSKASISNVIQNLEEQMGTRLLHRTTRKVQQTQDGIIFYERCKDLISDMEEVESLFRKEPARIKGRLRVDLPNRIAKAVVIPQLPTFLKKYPEIEIELSSTDRKVDLISEGFDCVLRVGSLKDSGIIVRKLGMMELTNCVSPRYIKMYGKPKKLEDLSQHYLIHYSQTLGSKPEGFEYFDGSEYRIVEMTGRIAVNNTETYVAACLAGFGIIQVPTVSLKHHFANGTLVEVLPEFKAMPMPISLVYPHRRNLNKRVQVFMDWMTEIMREYLLKGDPEGIT